MIQTVLYFYAVSKVVAAFKNISEGSDLETCMDVDNLLKCMAVHVFSAKCRPVFFCWESKSANCYNYRIHIGKIDYIRCDIYIKSALQAGLGALGL